MKRNLLFILSIISCAVSSCRSDSSDVQQIDQIVNVYIDSVGIDMLNPKIDAAYRNVSLFDLYGTRDNVPVSFSLKKNADTVKYIEYIAGATRKLIDSSDVKNKIYESKMLVAFTKQVSSTGTSVFNDTLSIKYLNSEQVFQVKEVFYNKIKVFSKVQGEPNIVKISK